MNSMKSRLEQLFRHLWYRSTAWYYLLLPISWIYCAIVMLRRALYTRGIISSHKVDCRVIVVGNLVVGGGGKTPSVIAMANLLTGAGYRVGVLCRGYRGRADRWPQSVTPASSPNLVGDEAVMVAERTAIPVVAGPDRVAAARLLLSRHHCDVLILDDGLQHYALRRDIEISVADATRGYGNRHCLPAGPLREPLSRLAEIDAVISVDGEMPESTAIVRRHPGDARNLSNPENTRKLAEFAGQQVHAVAGIANPESFFNLLKSAGLNVSTHAFADHHAFTLADLDFDDQTPVLMTEKDAVKCRSFAQANWWYIPLELGFDNDFETWLLNAVDKPEH
jgi:tetraacyldisaccharide 4'-kinase